MPVSEVYSQENAIAEFFTQTRATRTSCESKALELVGGTVVAVEIQGVCSYTVYAGPSLQHAVQFRLNSLKLDPEIATLAKQIHGSLAPNVTFHGALGDAADDDRQEKEPLLVYVMDRMKGIPHLDFILAHGHPENSPSNLTSRRNLLTSIAHFMAQSWNAPQPISTTHREALRKKYSTDLHLLLATLPARFHPAIQNCLDSLHSILSLPMVLLHRDFGMSNVLVDDPSCRLTGVIDWAEAEICPFGQNLHSLEAFTGAFHLRDGWRRYEDYEELQARFWSAFEGGVGGELEGGRKRAVEAARVMGLLRSRGFTKRGVGLGAPVPVCGGEVGGEVRRYNILYLDGLLVNAGTRFLEL